jgi:hypothetical protein
MLVGGPFVSLSDSKSAKSRNFFNTSLRSPSPAALYTVRWFSPGPIRTSEIIANPAWIVNTPIKITSFEIQPFSGPEFFTNNLETAFFLLYLLAFSALSAGNIYIALLLHRSR